MNITAPFLPDDFNKISHQEALVTNYSAPAPACTVCTTRLAAYQDIIKRPSTIIKTPFLKTYLIFKHLTKINFFIALIILSLLTLYICIFYTMSTIIL